ncbi:MAG TPA: peroxidase, partial [Roseiarcus sp.]|nr:peroxidase [Roseiarcus sp.]
VNMFVGRPPGNYDRLLDFSRAVTGSLFFAPSATFLEKVGEAAPPPSDEGGPEARPAQPDGSLGIGSLRGESGHE